MRKTMMATAVGIGLLVACGGRSNDYSLEGAMKNAGAQGGPAVPVEGAATPMARQPSMPGSGVTPTNHDDIRRMSFDDRQKEAIRCEKSGELDRAELCYQLNVEQTKEEEPKGWKYPGTLRTLAFFYHYKSINDKAEQAFKDYIEAQKSVEGPDHPYVASAVIDFTGWLNFQGRYEDSIIYYDQALAIYDKVKGPGSANALQVMRWKAGAYRNLNKNDEADKIEAEAKRIEAAQPSPTPAPPAAAK